MRKGTAFALISILAVVMALLGRDAMGIVTDSISGTGNARASAAPGIVTVIGVAPSHSSVKITYQPVPGAKDYRAYDQDDPDTVKYAGLAHLIAAPACPGASCYSHFLAQSDGTTPVFPYQVTGSYPNGGTGGPQVLDVPALEIDWNNVGDGQPHTLIVEAVAALGPVPPANLYTGANNDPLQPDGMLGSNKGQTPDGKLSTNGQGPYTNNPQVLARSAPFTVQANPGYKAIPSKGTASQTFFDTFEDSEGDSLDFVSRDDRAGGVFNSMGTMEFTLGAGTPRAWSIQYRDANNRDSMPFIASDHFMDALFDGATPGANAPTHTIYGSMSMSPAQAINISGGKIAHLTMEVDGHSSFRRWLDFNLAPASDPLQGWSPPDHATNNTGRAIFMAFSDSRCSARFWTGTRSATDLTPVGSEVMACGAGQMFVARNFSKSALGFDNKSRYDLFISQTHLAVFQDGKLLNQADIPSGSFTWADQPLKAYYTHYLYHSANDVDDLLHVEYSGNRFCYPLNSYWFNDPKNGTAAGSNGCNAAYPAGYGFRHSDERHWDNMGFEVLPASDAPRGDFAGLGTLVQLPSVQPVTPPSTTATPSSTLPPVPTSGMTSTPVSTSTPLPTSTPRPGATNTPAPSVRLDCVYDPSTSPRFVCE